MKVIYIKNLLARILTKGCNCVMIQALSLFLGVLTLEETKRQVYKDDFAEYLLCLALDVGEGLLRSGAEIRRVEDTIERICLAYGAAHVEVMSIISFINAAIRMPDGSYSSQMRRVKSTGMKLDTMEHYNALSREICKETPPLETFELKIQEIKSIRGYPVWLILAAAMVTVGAFAIFFGGTLVDSIMAAAIGLVISLIDMYASKRLNSMAKMVISSFAASFIAGVSVWLGIGDNPETIIIGSIMLLVPGLAFGSALRDLLYGDLLAGTLKTLQACLSALMIAFGYMIATFLLGGVAI